MVDLGDNVTGGIAVDFRIGREDAILWLYASILGQWDFAKADKA